MDPSIKCKSKLSQLEAAYYGDQTLSLQFGALAVQATAALPPFPDESQWVAAADTRLLKKWESDMKN